MKHLKEGKKKNNKILNFAEGGLVNTRSAQ